MELTGLFFYLVSVLIAGGIYAVLCLALNVQWGMGGLFNHRLDCRQDLRAA